jgi:hypothetical protein
MAKPKQHDDATQSRAFIEKAREIGADEEKSAADALMGRLAKTPPDPKHKPTAKPTGKGKKPAK